MVVTITVKKVIGAIREDDGKSNYMFFLGTLRFFVTLKLNILEFKLRIDANNIGIIPTSYQHGIREIVKSDYS